MNIFPLLVHLHFLLFYTKIPLRFYTPFIQTKYFSPNIIAWIIEVSSVFDLIVHLLLILCILSLFDKGKCGAQTFVFQFLPNQMPPCLNFTCSFFF